MYAIFRKKFPVLLLVFLAGLFSIVYELLWFRKLSLVLGGTTIAGSVTLVTYFIGMATGQLFFEHKLRRFKLSLKKLSFILFCLVFFAFILFIPSSHYALLVALAGKTDSFALQLLTKSVIAFLIMFPVAFIGGILFPFIFNIFSKSLTSVSISYGVFSLGGTAGTFIVPFLLLPNFGFNITLTIAIFSNILFAVTILILKNKKELFFTSTTNSSFFSRKVLHFAILSGFCTFSLELLSLKMFTLVDHNSTYTFALVLTIILFAFSTGSLLTSALIKKTSTNNMLFFQLILISLSLLFLPDLFTYLTDGLYPLEGKPMSGWYGYLSKIISVGAGSIFIPLVFSGMLFPTLLHQSNTNANSSKNGIGRLLVYNTFGVIVGYLTILFIAPTLFGLWKSIYLIAIIYILSSFTIAVKKPYYIISGVLTIICILFLTTSKKPLYRAELTQSPNFELVDFKETVDGTIAVVKSPDNLRLLLNNKYFLGGTRSKDLEANQTTLPLLIHNNPQKVFFIGMGTGITAGAALHFPVKQVTVSEIIPDVIPLAKKWFTPYTNNLFTDPRVHIIPEDGLWLLKNQNRNYDVIICDLILPWESGAGRLYSKECFTTVKKRLADNGIFALCLPLYQLSKQDFLVICKTMTSTFPLVTMWRNNFIPKSPSIILTGFKNPATLSINNIDNKITDSLRNVIGLIPGNTFTAHDILSLYCGNISQIVPDLKNYPLNTEDNMLIEYHSPIEHYQSVESRGANWFTGDSLIDFMQKFQYYYPAAKDPYLSSTDRSLYAIITNGLMMYRDNNN